MNIRLAILVVLVAVCLPAKSQEAAKVTQPDRVSSTCEITQEDNAVFSALMDGLGSPEDPEEAWANKEIVVVSETNIVRSENTDRGGWGFRSKSNAAPADETVESLKERAKTSCPLELKFPTSHPYEFISKAEIDSFFGSRKKGHDGWEMFYKKHPQAAGFWSFSLPGYNQDGTEALLSVSHSCGWLCGTGHLYLLRKESDKWIVTNRLMLWIS